MHIELDPPAGVSGFAFGMPAEEVKQAAAVLGDAPRERYADCPSRSKKIQYC